MGIVYILVNSEMPDLVKIGRTLDIEQRMRELSRPSGVPIAFQCFYAREVEAAEIVENNLHDAFKDARINSKKEFFRIDPERVLSALKLAPGKNVTPPEEVVDTQEELEALERQTERRSHFRFSKVGINPRGNSDLCER